ncbi:hypothetical protein ACMYR3_02965 [Ampullimonas aquatilis]|uniref:hypothetical protein n=1 Tax=Ampullimonas aquatilis TaxID=1341549 RepID=UPI003C7171A8
MLVFVHIIKFSQSAYSDKPNPSRRSDSLISEYNQEFPHDDLPRVCRKFDQSIDLVAVFYNVLPQSGREISMRLPPVFSVWADKWGMKLFIASVSENLNSIDMLRYSEKDDTSAMAEHIPLADWQAIVDRYSLNLVGIEAPNRAKL